MYPFDCVFLRVPCPRCRYGVDVRFRLAQLEDVAFCPGCKARIQFSDDGASGHRARRDTHNAAKKLRQKLKNLNETLTIEM